MSIRRTIKIIATQPRMLYHRVLRRNQIGKGTWVAENTFLSNCRIGKYVFIGGNCVINHTQIGNYCSIAPAVQIGGMEHDYTGLTTCAHLSQSQVYGVDTIIEDDVWIGASCIIKQGVKIGRGAVIGANSFVTKDVKPYTVVYGTPAKYIKDRFSIRTMSILEKSRYWEYDIKKAKEILDQVCHII